MCNISKSYVLPIRDLYQFRGHSTSIELKSYTCLVLKASSLRRRPSRAMTAGTNHLPGGGADQTRYRHNGDNITNDGHLHKEQVSLQCPQQAKAKLTCSFQTHGLVGDFITISRCNSSSKLKQDCCHVLGTIMVGRNIRTKENTINSWLFLRWNGLYVLSSCKFDLQLIKTTVMSLMVVSRSFQPG